MVNMDEREEDRPRRLLPLAAAGVYDEADTPHFSPLARSSFSLACLKTLQLFVQVTIFQKYSDSDK